MSAREQRAAIVGWGMSGRILHAPLLQAAGFTVKAVVSGRPEAVRADLPGARVFDSLPALLEAGLAELVVICSPSELHVQQALLALPACRVVVVEKPVAIDALEFATLDDQAGARIAALTVFHNRRWDSDFLTVRRLLAAGTLGKLHTVGMNWDRYRPLVRQRWRESAGAGAGVLMDLGPHLVDQTLQLFGPPHWVEAALFRRRESAQSDDAFRMHLGYDGLQVTLQADSLVSAPRPRFELHGALASFVKYGLDAQEDQLKAGLAPQDPAFGREPDSRWGQLTHGETGETRVVGSERGSWLDFYQAIALHLDGRGALPVTVAEAAAGIRVIDAARASAARGLRVRLRT